MDDAALGRFVDQSWGDEVVPTLIDYIKIPNKSPHFDPDWVQHGYMADAVTLFSGWAKKKIAGITGASLEIVTLPGRTPVILIDLPGEGSDTILLYGHLDKQPEMVGWADGYGPWIPRLEGDKLFGRGGADDGYAMFGALTAILALRDQKIPHSRCVVLIEACEESGSYDLPFYVDHLAPRIGEPVLVICLDSGCGNYDQLWLTTSLRGLVSGTLEIEMLREGVHSGDASGVVPSPIRILRQLLSRIEDEASGTVHLKALQAPIPAERVEQARQAAQVLGDGIYGKFPFVAGARPVTRELVELILNRSWRPQLAVIGMAGLPEPVNAGNVLLPIVKTKLSLRLPPTLDATPAAAAFKEALEADPPYGARVTFADEGSATGWNAPVLSPWLARSLDKAGQAAFGAPTAFMGEGGSIPFMWMLGAKFPKAQFVVTGVLGPASNAHGPNEFLHIPTARKLSRVIAQVVADHYAAAGK